MRLEGLIKQESPFFNGADPHLAALTTAVLLLGLISCYLIWTIRRRRRWNKEWRQITCTNYMKILSAGDTYEH